MFLFLVSFVVVVVGKRGIYTSTIFWPACGFASCCVPPAGISFFSLREPERPLWAALSVCCDARVRCSGAFASATICLSLDFSTLFKAARSVVFACQPKALGMGGFPLCSDVARGAGGPSSRSNAVASAGRAGRTAASPLPAGWLVGGPRRPRRGIQAWVCPPQELLAETNGI